MTRTHSNRIKKYFPDRSIGALQSFISSHKDDGLEATVKYYIKKLKASYVEGSKVIIRPVNSREAEFLESKSKKKDSLSGEDIQRLKDINSSRRGIKEDFEEDEEIQMEKVEKRAKYKDGKYDMMKEIKLNVRKEDDSEEYEIVPDFEDKLKL